MDRTLPATPPRLAARKVLVHVRHHNLASELGRP